MKFPQVRLPKAVTRTVSRQILVTKKHSPTLLFGAGVVGVVATVVTSSRATLKLEGVLTDAQKDRENARVALGLNRPDYTEQDYKKDMTVLYVRHATAVCKLYAPSLALGVLSIVALTSAHKIQQNRLNGLSAAYAALMQGFQEYRGRVVAEYGEEKDREFRYGVTEREIVVEDKNGPKKEVVKTVGDGGGSIYSKLFDETNPNWDEHMEYNLIFLRGQQSWINDRLQAQGHVMLNDVYDLLGFERTPAGSQVGWIWDPSGKSGDTYIDFGIWDDRSMTRVHEFLMGREGCLWLDFNVQGEVWRKIGKVGRR